MIIIINFNKYSQKGFSVPIYKYKCKLSRAVFLSLLKLRCHVIKFRRDSKT